MTFSEYQERKIPEYYPDMYKDGYDLWEIRIASKKRMNRILRERRKAAETVEEVEIHITSEVRGK